MDHRDVLEKALASAEIGLTVIPDYATWLREGSRAGPSGGLGSRVSRMLSQFGGTSDRDYVSDAAGRIDRAGIGTVIAYWGTIPLPDIIALKRARPAVRFFLNVLCHPLGLTPGRIRLQNMLMRNAVSALDGFIVSSSAMRQYVQNDILRGRELPILLLPPCWTRDYLASESAPAAKPKPNIVFLGRMDRKHGQPSDDVYDFLLALMQEGVDVHFGRSRDGDIEHPHAFPFTPIPLAEVAGFASRFDASLVVYNMGAVKQRDRFENTVPDRLIASVSIGIPIALPREGFSGCKEYLRDLGAVMLYDSPADLARQLQDRQRMSELRSTAQANFRRYTAESHLPALLGFLHEPAFPQPDFRQTAL